MIWNYLINFILLFWISFNKISEINKIKSLANDAFQSGNFIEASLNYDSLVSHFKIDNEEIILNLGHSLFQCSDTARAKEQYIRLSGSQNHKLSSIAYQQLGIIAFESKNINASIDFFKQALKIDPLNEQARYNYELMYSVKESSQNLMKIKTSRSKKASKEKPLPENKNLTENTEEKDSFYHNSGQDKEAEVLKSKLKAINLSEAKAAMILEHLKNSEVQYWQQVQKDHSSDINKDLPQW